MQKLEITLQLFLPARFHRHSMITSARFSISLPGDSWPYSFRLRNTRTRLGSRVSKARRSRQKEKFSSRPDGWKFMAVKPRVTSQRKICHLSGKEIGRASCRERE